MCCAGAKWKREVVQDHKFDFVDVHEYRVTGFFTRLRYAFVYIFVIKSVLVYLSDIYTAVAMLANDYWSGNILAESDNSSTIKVPFTIGKWIFTGCIIFSFLLLAWESRKARMIIRSRDISYAFTNIMANNYYSMKSYDHFCFFSQINNSKKKKDEFAFFVFFTFKGWKRLLLADAPRQVINALTLYSFGKAFNFTTDLSKYYNNDDGHFSFIRAGILCTMIFTVVIWAGSAILLTVAAFMYIPLLCYIQGNLKEYCCHKIDKRIAELMKRKTKKRVQREAEFAKREAAGDFRHLQDKKGRFKDGHAPLPQPTLPAINLNDDELFGESKSDVASSYKRNNSQKGASGGVGGGYGQGYPPPPSMADLTYGGEYGNGYSDPYNQYQRYQLSDGGVPGDSSYSLATQGQGQRQGHQAYPYPSQTSLNMHTNDSMLSFNDEKMSIRSRDPLIGAGVGNMPGADLSQASLHDAPSYHTHQEDDDPYNLYMQQPDEPNHVNPANSYGSYDYKRTSPQDGNTRQQQQRHIQGQQQQQYQYEPDPQHPYSDPPYALDDQAFAQDAQQQQQYLQDYGQGQGGHGNQYPPSNQQHSSHLQSQPQAHNQLRQPDAIPRGVSVAGRSEISTMYFMEERDRASMADSHMGAFDLDDYGRASIFNPGAGQAANGWQGQGQGQGHHLSGQRRGSNLEYLEEVDEGPQDYDQRHQQYPQSRPQDRRR